MYPASSSQKPMAQTGLTRYGSAPGSLLTTAVDSVIGANSNLVGHYFSTDSSSLTSESTCKVSSSNDPQEPKPAAPPPHGSYPAPSSSSLLRQRSSPAGFLSHLKTENVIAGFSLTRGTGNYSSQADANGGHGVSRLKSQLSVTRQDSLSQISEFSLPQTTLEMATVEKLLHIPEDSVPCKIRAKRGCATHPRSIAERERRTRISGKLKKLQELVPNMDKQTSYADMLDLAVQHIKGLQNEVQKLHRELESCTCGCKEGS
ncbi:transcription factor bHLH128-like isoform X3 [Durio zibethinus]|uniref:Transcription factor bHLH128-like isoform X3 n=1 Tax=Durio zibethinus TaxID=66656 RepID=A0A6P5X259_DURZI|nr:transcription factor bHLH128-like isoform X3 [Durio zibethinus]